MVENTKAIGVKIFLEKIHQYVLIPPHRVEFISKILSDDAPIVKHVLQNQTCVIGLYFVFYNLNFSTEYFE